jgi:hypothetical protein
MKEEQLPFQLVQPGIKSEGTCAFRQPQTQKLFPQMKELVIPHQLLQSLQLCCLLALHISSVVILAVVKKSSSQFTEFFN